MSDVVIHQESTLNTRSLFMPLIGGLLGALIGSVIWAGVDYFLAYEHSTVAIIVGYLAGRGTMWFVNNKVNIGHYVTAIITTLLGIGLGKYVAYYLAFVRYEFRVANTDFDLLKALADYPPFDAYSVEFLVNSIMADFDMYDVTFVGIALCVAFLMVSAKRNRIASQRQNELAS